MKITRRSKWIYYVRNAADGAITECMPGTPRQIRERQRDLSRKMGGAWYSQTIMYRGVTIASGANQIWHLFSELDQFGEAEVCAHA